MNREQIIRMAREACPYTTDEMRGAFYEGFIKGAAAEREACAKVAEETVCDTHLPTGVKIYGSRAAAAIRARGQA